LFLWISPEGFGALGMRLNFAVAISVSRLALPPSDAIKATIEDIRVPKGASEALERQTPPV
jgi:cation/acetate symporter